MSLQPEAPTSAAAPAPRFSLFSRAVAIFARPASAWSGLEERAQWWFPLLVIIVLQLVIMWLLYHRAYLPMYFDQLDAQLASGAIQQAQAARAEQIMQSPVMVYVTAGMAGLTNAIFMFLMALLVWFGVSFILGARFRYRLALETTTWSALVWIPQQIAFFALAWSQQTMKGIHFGLAAFLPDADPPAKWHTALSVILDALGPFNIWFVAVAVLGCAALSGAPRRSVAWVLGGLAVVVAVVSALVSGWLAPAS